MKFSNIDAVAAALVRARRDHLPADAASLAAALANAADAYAVQQRVAGELGWFDGASPRHWKSGGPSRDAVLTHAPLPPAGVWASPARSGAWPFHLRGIEAEVALRLARDVDAALAATLDADSARTLVDAMAVSIELVDSRWREALEAPALCKLADLQSHGALVLGDWMPFEARDWRAQTCRVRIGAQAPVERRGTHSLGDPAFLLPAWLRHATRDDSILSAGTVVTTGTWVGILHAAEGDLVTAEFPGIGQASVQL
ncbi:2-keto-4-pentenoate hydratase [Variovorax sp. WS11]|uniref:fumarylacetoacetate hydrolase family protein n=1 Tax=Variovorax sp. WS11 TaxID=1105204 RepID=UPI000D0DBC29|nr:fumarylacetoacetate hydrolase family protein [Variovorax sp. WS11]NDZ13787.1 2-keto-4-pentenoate hydratase [Variovorax sp. WS11]PSL79434.1 2-keto-4-pentenoate hydratase [Variovorax sp. WS11]